MNTFMAVAARLLKRYWQAGPHELDDQICGSESENMRYDVPTLPSHLQNLL